MELLNWFLVPPQLPSFPVTLAETFLGRKIEQILGISNFNTPEFPVFVFVIKWMGYENNEAILMADAMTYFGPEVSQFLHHLQQNISYFSNICQYPWPTVPPAPEPKSPEGMDFEDSYSSSLPISIPSSSPHVEKCMLMDVEHSTGLEKKTTRFQGEDPVEENRLPLPKSLTSPSPSSSEDSEPFFPNSDPADDWGYDSETEDHPECLLYSKYAAAAEAEEDADESETDSEDY